MATDKKGDDLLQEARKTFDLVQEAEEDNRRIAVEDMRFALDGQQWPENIITQREKESRPMLTVNKLKPFIRQVVNDARQNKPSIKVHPVDSGADPETAKVINGLIRNIERTSKADIAYDTAVECAAAGGFGYMRVGIDYAYDDTFDMDITINRVADPFSIFGDPESTSADGSDWNTAFVVDRATKEEFEKRYGDKAQVDWDNVQWEQDTGTHWRDETGIMLAEYWKRVDFQEEIYRVTDGDTEIVLSQSQIEDDDELRGLIEQGALQVIASREITRKKVTQHIMTGQEVLESNEWPGRWIPIVPVYGEEYWIDGNRKLRSLIHSAVDAQRMHNYWRTTSTELVSLAPRVPFIGEEGAFDADPSGWATANTVSHPFLEYSRGKQAPQRQPLDTGGAAGAIQEALMASDDMKSIIGMYDASLGARSNETSGRAIMARQREGDVATFHFADNLSRSIRHLGNIVLDLIPYVYDTERVVRVLGRDDVEESKPINMEYPAMDENGQPMQDDDGNPIFAMHDLTAGKYDLTVSAGPSFTTMREEAAYQMTEALRAFPNAAPVLIPMIAKNSDWPDAEDVAEKLEALFGTGEQEGISPQIQAAFQQMQAAMQQLQAENEQLKNDRMKEMAELEIKSTEADIKAYDAETKRMKAEADAEVQTLKIETAPTVRGVQQ